MKVLAVFLVAVFTSGQVFAERREAFVVKGTLGLYTSGQDCDEIGPYYYFPAELVHERYNDRLYEGLVSKLTVVLGDEHTKVLSDFRSYGRDVLSPVQGSEEVIGEVRAIYDSLHGQTVRYDTDGKGAGDEVRFTYMSDDQELPSKLIVAGSRASRARDCVIEWLGEFMF